MAGQTQYKTVYEKHRERYLYAAWQEYRLNRACLINATILKVKHAAMSLYDFIEVIEAGEVNTRDVGTCGCMSYHPAFMSVVAQAPAQKMIDAAQKV